MSARPLSPWLWPLALIFISLAVWWPTRFLPYHWDTPGFIINGARHLDQINFLPFIVEHGSDFAHPPLFHTFLVLSWRLLGHTFLVSHLVSWFFFYLFLTAAYFLGRRYHSVSAGIWVSLLLMVTPYLLAEMGLVYLDLALAALFTLGLVFWLYHRPAPAIFIFCLAVFTKLTFLPAIPVLICYSYLKIRPRYPKSVYLLAFSLPLLCAALWLIYHHHYTGWWLVLPGRDTVSPQNLAELIQSAKFVLYVFFIRQNRWLLTLFGVLSWYNLRRHRKPVLPFIALSSLLIVTGLGAFVLSGEYIPRYSLYLVPIYYALSLSLILQAFPKPIGYLTILAIAISFLPALRPRPAPSAAYQFRVNEDLSYLDHIRVDRDAAQFLATEYPDTVVIGSFPQTYQLTQPHQGYVTRPLKFLSCSDFDPSTIDHYSLLILYLHPHHYTQIACTELLNQYPFTPLREFNRKGKWVKLFILTSP